jgi:membrane protease YdiL (CAAX protease family)
MLFRGVILRSFLQQYSRTTALLWSSLLFALAHLNAYQFFTALILGIVLGWLYERTRSLWPSILLHAAFNTFVTYLANAETPEPQRSLMWIYASASVCAVIGGRILLRILEPPTARAKTPGSD